MSELRDRVAAIIDREVDGLWEPLGVADAVIAELGLREEWGALDESMGGALYDSRSEVKIVNEREKVFCRFITEWEPE